MPIYEFRCSKCGEEFETLVLRPDEIVPCPSCESRSVKRLMSTCAFKSSGQFTPAKGSSGCASCSSGNCSTCH